jgi:Baseplate J-like protein
VIDPRASCRPDAPPTPLPVENRPGLSSLRYRVGTYASFREAMVEDLARADALARLTTRRSDDYAVTILELWSAVADVLAFYQERYANEAFLRTATRREAVARLAALLDYHPAPGAAAGTHLAFTIEAGKEVAIPIGLRVQSLPAPGEQAQVFETLEPVRADARLNRVRIHGAPLTGAPLAAGRTEVVLDAATGAAVAPFVAPRTRAVVFANGAATAPEEKEVHATRVEGARVVVEWTEPVASSAWGSSARAFLFTRTFRLFGHGVGPTFTAPTEVAATGGPVRSTRSAKKSSGGAQGQVSIQQQAQFRSFAQLRSSPAHLVWNLHNVAYAYPRSGNPAEAAATGESGTSRLCLDARYEALVAGGRLLVADTRGGGPKTLVTIVRVDQAQDELGPLTDSVTRVTVKPALPAFPDRREVLVYELGRELPLSTQRYPDRVTGNTVFIPVRIAGDGSVELALRAERGALTGGLKLRPEEIEVGRRVALSDASGAVFTGWVKALPAVQAPAGSSFGHVAVQLEVDGRLDLDGATAVLDGNVARAGHGETILDEPVGSGDASKRFQRFVLKRSPVTHVPSTAGLESSLVLLVNGARWQEVDGLFGRAGDERVFATRTTEDGATELRFGDGVHGAVLPTGAANVHATYRVGLGLAGRVRAGQLTTALDRPTGLVSVANPLPASGGADPEPVEAARRNAPRTVRTFGRAVSLRDFEDLVTATGEVAKAQATWVWDGLGRAIHVTVAAQGGAPFSASDLKRLAATLTAARDPNHPLRVANHVPVDVVVRARVAVEATRRRADVASAARAALADELSFDRLGLGRPVHLSDVFRVLQGVQGVDYVDVDELRFADPAIEAVRAQEPGVLQPHLAVFAARTDATAPGGVAPAEIARASGIGLDATGGIEG